MPELVARAPGRVNLIGEHTDYSGGLVLPAAIDRAVTLEVEAHPDRILLSSEHGEPVDLPADGSEAPASGWGRYVAAVAAELARAGRDPVGLRGRVHSDLPIGAGLSSSAALEVAVAAALCAVAGFALEPMALAQAAQRAEHQAVGVPCGIMDQAAAVLGRADHAILLDCGTLAHRAVPVPEHLRLVVIDSGVSRTLEGSGYAQRRAELEAGLPLLGGRAPGDVDPVELAGLLGNAGTVPARRVRHVVTENARVRATVAALSGPEPDLAALGPLFAASHASLREDYEVSIPELDLLVDLAGEAGALAARMTGGGFGGAMVALADADHADDLGHGVADRYTARTGHPATVLVCRPGPGAHPLPPPP